MPRRNRKSQRSAKELLVAGALSVLVHLFLAALVLPSLLEQTTWEPAEPAEEENQDFEVSVVTEEDLKREKERPRLPEPPEPPPEEEIEKVEKEKPVEQQKPREIEKIDRKVVKQETNEERPDTARFVSAKDNKTAEETRATDTTMEEVIPSKTERDRAAAKLARAEPPTVSPRKRPTRQRRPLADPSEIIKKPTETTETNEAGVKPVERRQKLFEVSEDDYMEVVGHEHDEAAHEAMQDKRLLAGWEEDERIMRGALENFITEVKPGNHTSVNSYGRAWADYLGRIHRKIHARWAADYLATLDIREPAGSPLNDPTLNTKLEFVIRASDGEIQRINIVKGSGELRYDAEAISISTSVGPHPHPPKELVSPDGNVYVHWNFWRNQRQCGVFGASVYIVEKDELSRD